MTEAQNYRIQFYSLSKEVLEEQIIELALAKNFEAQKIALAILEQATSGAITLPVQQAEAIIGQSKESLMNQLNSDPPPNKNTAALIALELERIHPVTEPSKLIVATPLKSPNVAAATTANANVAAGCAGLSTGLVVVLVIVIIVLVSVLGSLLTGLLDIGGMFIKAVAH